MIYRIMTTGAIVTALITWSLRGIGAHISPFWSEILVHSMATYLMLFVFIGHSFLLGILVELFWDNVVMNMWRNE